MSIDLNERQEANFLNNLKITDGNNFSEIESEGYNKDYIFALFVLLLGFFAWAFYLRKLIVQRTSIDATTNRKIEKAANDAKYENLHYLFIASLGINIYYQPLNEKKVSLSLKFF